jgi:hypothetical protein
LLGEVNDIVKTIGKAMRKRTKKEEKVSEMKNDFKTR